MTDHYIENMVMSRKNPNEIINICNVNSYWHKLCSDQNSSIWHNLIINNYRKYYKKKNNSISLKDYYVLLYYSEILGLLSSNIIYKAQTVLSLLPRVYEGDHIAILHACSNPAIMGDHAKIIMYRDKTNIKSTNYGRGYLHIQFKKYSTDCYVDKNNLDSFKNANCVDPYLGGYDILKAYYY